jgi:hypothetical protein
MSVSFPLPPTSRDLLVYERITVDCVSTREVAAALGISQTRVRQIVKKVLHWLAQTLPADSDLDKEAALRVAQHIAADRLQRYLIEADRLWKQTLQAKYANLCFRIITAQSKIPAFPGDLEALAADAIERGADIPVCQDGETERQSDGGTQGKTNVSPSLPPSVPPSSASPPPPRDCSPKPTSPASDARPQASQPSPSSSRPEPSAELPPTKSAARKTFLSPAHPLAAPGDQSPVTELKITPQELGFRQTPTRSVSEGPRLSRRERRRLRQKMESK